jgi:hypothetical protein
MLPRPSSPLVWALAVALAIAAAQTVRLDAARVRGVRAALAADSVEAARDTSRLVRLDGETGRSLADSLRVVQRRTLQVSQRSDALDRALGLERAARAQLEATVESLRATARVEQVAVEAGDQTRSTEFDVRQVPYTVHAAVTLPEPPGAGRLDVVVSLDTLKLDVRVECGARRLREVRPATVSVAGPAWASVRLGRVEQAPEVCNGGEAGDRGGNASLLHALGRRFGVSVGYVAVRAGDGVVRAGPGIVVGFRVWP